jgi:hypothetical protein
VLALGGTGAVCDALLAAAAALPAAPGGPADPGAPLAGRLLYGQSVQLNSLDLATGTERRVVDRNPDTPFAVSWDGTEVVYGNGPASSYVWEIVIHDTTTGEQKLAFELPDGQELFLPVTGILPAPGNQRFAVVERILTEDYSALVVLDRAGTVLGRYPGVQAAGWTPAGDLAVVLVGLVDGAPTSAGVLAIADGAQLGQPAVDTREIWRFDVADLRSFPSHLAVAPDGAQAAFSFNGDLHVIDLQPGAAPHRVARSTSDLRDAGWSPDSSRLVFRRADGTFGTGSVHIIPNHRGEAIDITGEGPTVVRKLEDGRTPRIFASAGQVAWQP